VDKEAVDIDNDGHVPFNTSNPLLTVDALEIGMPEPEDWFWPCGVDVPPAGVVECPDVCRGCPVALEESSDPVPGRLAVASGDEEITVNSISE